MLLGIICIGEATGRLDHYLRTHGSPIQLRRIFLRKNPDALAVYLDAILPRADVVWQVAQDGVVFEKMGKSLGIGQIVNGYELEIGIVDGGPENVASNAPEAINTYLDGHSASIMRTGSDLFRVSGINN